ncbi:MAG: YeeE/YedE family protein [Oligoflexia bacterium]|nr:YeeE/YedE family protein [Oligoflexia bacterium]
MESKNNYWNPYLSGVLLGGVLLLSFVTLGAGLGASGGMARIAAWLQTLVMSDHVLQSEYFGAWGTKPLTYYLVFMILGVFFGGLISALLAKRVKLQLEKGRTFSPIKRMGLASLGGVMVGFSTRLAQGCTSGQALTGGALLLTGSFVFLAAVFVTGYLFSYFMRRQWI